MGPLYGYDNEYVEMLKSNNARLAAEKKSLLLENYILKEKINKFICDKCGCGFYYKKMYIDSKGRLLEEIKEDLT